MQVSRKTDWKTLEVFIRFASFLTWKNHASLSVTLEFMDVVIASISSVKRSLSDSKEISTVICSLFL